MDIVEQSMEDSENVICETFDELIEALRSCDDMFFSETCQSSWDWNDNMFGAIPDALANNNGHYFWDTEHENVRFVWEGQDEDLTIPFGIDENTEDTVDSDYFYIAADCFEMDVEEHDEDERFIRLPVSKLHDQIQ